MVDSSDSSKDLVDGMLAELGVVLQAAAADEDGDDLTDAVRLACGFARQGLLGSLAAVAGSGGMGASTATPFLLRLSRGPLGPSESLLRVAVLAVCATEVSEPFLSAVLDVFEDSLTPAAEIFVSCVGSTSVVPGRVVSAEEAVAAGLLADCFSVPWRAVLLWVLQSGEQDACKAAFDALDVVCRLNVVPGGLEIVAGVCDGWVGSLDGLVDATVALAGSAGSPAS